MKILSSTLTLIFQFLFISVLPAQKPNPSLSFTQSEKLIFLDNENGKKNSISFKSIFKPDGCKNTSTLWEFSGINGKDWKVIGGSLESDEVELEFKDEAISEISRKAISKKTGARGLRSILENILLKTMFELPDMENVIKVTVDAATVKGASEPIITYGKKSSTSVA